MRNAVRRKWLMEDEKLIEFRENLSSWKFGTRMSWKVEEKVTKIANYK